MTFHDTPEPFPCYSGRSAATIRGPESPGTDSRVGPFDFAQSLP